jgi:alpha-galactosidase
VDQDPLGSPAKRISSNDGVEVWARTLADGSTAVGLFNRGYIEMPAVVKWSDLKLQGPHMVRDLWLQKDLGRLSGQFATSVRPHGAVFVKIK